MAMSAQTAGDVFAWFFNVSSAVSIILVNKVLMGHNGPYKFTFATTLCGFHYLTCAVAMWIAEHLGLSKPARVPFKDLAVFVVTSSISIASLNLSLMLNSVGFYQIAKLLNVPFVCAVEAIFFNRPMTLPVIVAAAVVVSGVAVVSVTDVSVKAVGACVAMVSVVSSGMQQITCGELQRNYELTPNQLLSVSAPAQGMLVLVFGPFIDRWLAHSWVFNYKFTVGSIAFLALSCSIAILVNVSQFMCLGRFSATSFQVMGHAKTVCVLLIGWAMFGDTFTMRKFIGMCMAVLGMMIYGYFAGRKSTPKVAEKKAGEDEPLLKDTAR